jgi:hypothetical protein
VRVPSSVRRSRGSLSHTYSFDVIEVTLRIGLVLIVGQEFGAVSDRFVERPLHCRYARDPEVCDRLTTKGQAADSAQGCQLRPSGLTRPGIDREFSDHLSRAADRRTGKKALYLRSEDRAHTLCYLEGDPRDQTLASKWKTR